MDQLLSYHMVATLSTGSNSLYGSTSVICHGSSTVYGSKYPLNMVPTLPPGPITYHSPIFKDTKIPRYTLAICLMQQTMLHRR